MADTKYTHRYIAKIVIEAITPLSVGSGQKDIISDAMVVLDVNGFPYIPGTSLAGVIRHAIGKDANTFFGCPEEESSKGHGSDIIFTSAQMIGDNGNVIDGLVDRTNFDSAFYKHFKELPVRQHVRISEKGTSEGRGKFDEQVVFKGMRFCFEIEMVDEDSEAKKTLFESVLEKLTGKSFAIGSGTRGGFGKLEVKKELSKVAYLDLSNNVHLQAYLEKSSNLSDEQFWTKSFVQPFNANENNANWTKYELKLESDDFFLFGSGFGNKKANMTPVTESYIDWTGNRAEFINNNILIPATSLKGALSHRVAFYYNRLNGYTIKEIDGKYIKDENAKTGSKNPAVYALFGSEDTDDPQIGNILFFDIIEKPKTGTKILNHNAIDRFTGGTIDGALFSEEVNYGNGQIFSTQFLLNKENVKKVISDKLSGKIPKVESETVFRSLQLAIDDLCNEMLPLGGGVNRGNGCFKGTCTPKIQEHDE